MESSEISESPLITREGKILKVIFHRPTRGNSLDPPTLVHMRQALIDAQENEKIRVILLTGSGEKDFCTGIDVNSARDLSPENKTNIANIAGDIATLLYHGKPAVVAINGRAMGMGIVFATAADFRYGVDTATFQMPEVNVGIFPGASCIPLMTRVCGLSWTRKMLLGGDPITAPLAKTAQIIDEIVSKEELPQKSREMAQNLSRKNAFLLKNIKLAINNAAELPYHQIISLETELADYYRWDNPAQKNKLIKEKYRLGYQLTGDPAKLLEEYSKIVPT
jgi:enoyl-CoA hydratase/carnithine racemase